MTTTTTVAGTIARHVTARRYDGQLTHLTVIELVTGTNVMHDTINLNELFGTPGDTVHVTIEID